MARPKFAPGRAEPVYADLLARAGATGISSGEIGVILGLSREAAANYLCLMRGRGTAVSRLMNASTASARWYAPDVAPAQQVVVAVRPRSQPKPKATVHPARTSHKAKTLPPGEPIYPPGLQINRAQTPQSRYAVTEAVSRINSAECRPWAAAATGS